MVIDLDMPFGYESEKPQAVTGGNKRADDFYFTITYSHATWDFSCNTLSEITESAFSVIESYLDMVH